ncbi:MAG: uroporphyrinogen decarboxylase family protein [Anaerolineales bacterium]|jgi:uroporphyrinogen decarboxylase
MASRELTHRQRLELVLEGQTPDRPPVALWRHFPVDDQTPLGLADATVDFQQTYDFDLVKVTPSSSFCLKDWGVADEWRGSPEGTRDYTRRVIHHPDDWTHLVPLEPNKGYLGDQLECLRLIVSRLGADTPVIQTIFNPLSQAKNLAGGENLVVHLRRYPDALHAGLRTIVETTLRFMEAALETGIAGVFFAVQHAQYGLLSEQEYQTFGRAYDLQVLEPAQELWLNVLHLHGEEVMFDALKDYPVGVINWHDRDTPPSLAEAQERFPGVVCGGLKRWDTMILGTPEGVDAEARHAIQSTGGQRFILGTGCVLPVIAPRGNTLAARQSVNLST